MTTSATPRPAAAFAIGSLVRARGREWTVLPDSEGELLVLRPLGGTEDEVTGIYLPLEAVTPATFDLPDPDRVGDHQSARLLRDAVRLGFRSSAGPFRSFGKIAVEPRPYQLVPLLVGLRSPTVRMLIADDVGIGKTVEACLIARELLDRGEEQRLAVLCPPHLAEQWQLELRTKFNIEAELVLSSTVRKLERVCGVGESLFQHYPYVIVSTDFIKSEKYRLEFKRTCPDLVIIDEAHTCAFGDRQGTGRHQRYDLVKALAEDRERHLILVTATPHSGNEAAFRSLLELLDPEFANLPDDLTGPRNEGHRRRLAQHLVQRRRADIEHYLDEDTPFPDRKEREASYVLSPAYKRLFQRALDYARETVHEPGEAEHRQRVRWWSALALLRSLASSPAAAAETLRARAVAAGAETTDDADELGRRSVLDLDNEDASATIDAAPGSDFEDDDNEQARHRRRLREMAREADALCGDNDTKLIEGVRRIQELLDDGFNPIVFCRFIPTAEYVARELRARLTGEADVVAVTGTLPPDDREARVAELAKAPRRVLVATDCLSEGINLQQWFDAVMHYDLSWNPTRHEQREGRVDRFQQPSKEVRVLTYYGKDNQIDGIVLEVLLRKHQKIRNSLGVSVPVPGNTNDVIEAVFNGLLAREAAGRTDTDQLALFDNLVGRAKRSHLLQEWEAAADREKRSRTMFAQETIRPEQVARELAAIRASMGSAADVERFVRRAVTMHRGHMTEHDGALRLDLRECPRGLRDAIGGKDILEGRFALPTERGEVYLNRTHPMVEGLASYVMETALDADLDGLARRSGAIRTDGVRTRATLLLVRCRYHIMTRRARGEGEQELLAEDLRLLAFEGAPEAAEWLDEAEATRLLELEPSANVPAQQATNFVRKVTEGFAHVAPHVEAMAHARGDEILDAHRRVRQAARMAAGSIRIEPKLPADVLGVFVFLPVAPGQA